MQCLAQWVPGELPQTSSGQGMKLATHLHLQLQKVEAAMISRQSAHEGGKVVSLMHWLPLPSTKCPWYSFLLEAELTPGTWRGRKDEAYKISSNPIGNCPCNLLACSTASQPTTPPCMPTVKNECSYTSLPTHAFTMWTVTTLLCI
jgi:hypothetical protein